MSALGIQVHSFNLATGEAGNGNQFFSMLSTERYQQLQTDLDFEWPRAREDFPYGKAYEMAHLFQWAFGNVCWPCGEPEHQIKWYLRR